MRVAQGFRKMFGKFPTLRYFLVRLLPLLFIAFTPLNARFRVIRNQATAVFELHGVTYTAFSNIVSTSVLPVFDFDIIPNGDTLQPAYRVSTFPGNEIYLGYVLRNLGNARDSFRIFATYIIGDMRLEDPRVYLDDNNNGRLDPGEDVPISGCLTVNPDSFVSLIVAFHVPNSSEYGDSAYVNIVGISESTGRVDNNNWSLVKIPLGVVISAWKSVNTPITHPGDTLRYEIGFLNVGQQTADSIVLIDYINYNGSALYTTFVPHSDGSSPQSYIEYLWRSDLNWHDSLPNTPGQVAGLKAIFHDISSGQGGRFWFNVVVDSNVPDSAHIENVAFFISYGAQGSVSDTTLTNIAVTMPRMIPILHIGPEGNPRALPRGEGSEDDIQTVDSAESGVWLTFRNTVLNEGPISTMAEFRLDLSGLRLGSNPIVYLTDGSFNNFIFDSDGDGFPDIGPIPPGGVRDIGIKIWIPDSLMDSLTGEPLHRSVIVSVFPDGFDSLVNSTIDRFSVRRPRNRFGLRIHKTVIPDTIVYDGSLLQFEIAFENVGDSVLRNFNIYDRLAPAFCDPVIPEHLIVEDDSGNFAPIPATGSFDESTRFVRFFMDSIPPGFAGTIRFGVRACIADSGNEVVASNVASGIGRGMDRADTSNRVNVHILRPILKLEKRAVGNNFSMGDVVTYKLSISNNASNGTIYNVTIYDTLPMGFRHPPENWLELLQGGRLISDTGNILVFGIDSLPVNTTFTIRMKLLIGPGAGRGRVENRAWGDGEMPGTGTIIRVGPASAVIDVRDGFATPNGFIFGRVFVDYNDNRVQDAGEPGVPNVIVRLDNGLYAVTDSFGKYSIPNVSAGIHGVWLDMSCVPEGLVPEPISFNSMGDGRSQVISLPASSNYRANFRLVRLVAPITRFETGATLTKTAHVIADSFAINVTMPSTHFETGKAELMPDAPIEEFRKIADFVRHLPGWKVIVEGHTDPRPIHTKEFPDNYALSMARARAVAELLKSFGVPDSVIEIHGYGPDRPKVPNTSLANMAVNRRTEVRVVPSKGAAKGIVEYRIRFLAGDRPLDSLVISDVVPGDMELDSVVDVSAPKGSLPELSVEGNRIVLKLRRIEPFDTVVLRYRVRVVDVVSAAKYFNNARARFYMDGQKVGHTLRTSVGIDTSALMAPISYTLRFPSDILFETGRAELRKQSIPYLEQVLRLLNEYPSAKARLEGHTDPRPIHTEEFPSNWELSRARAMAVYNWLIQHGIDSSRLEVKWFADTRPLVPNTSARNMAINRRTEVIIYFPPEKVRTETLSDSDNVRVVTLRFKVRQPEGAGDIRIEDHIPAGTAFVPGSAYASGKRIADPEVVTDSAGNSTLIFDIPSDAIDRGDTLVFSYAVKTGSVSQAPQDSSVARIEAIDTLTLDDVPAILYPSDGQIFTNRNVINVDVVVHYMVPFQLKVNGEIVPMEKCGITKKVQSKMIEERVFIGVRLKPGENVITLKGIDKKGKTVERTVRVYVSGPPEHIELSLLNAPITADGVTRPKIQVTLKDKNGYLVGSNMLVNFTFRNVEPYTEDARPAMPGFQAVIDSGRATIELAPSSKPVKAVVIASYSEDITDSIVVEYMPKLSPFEVFAFGQAWRGIVETPNGRSRFGDDVGFLWAHGRVWKDVVLTASVRSDPRLDSVDVTTPLMGTRSPLNDLYPTYGDASRVVSFATSRNGLFFRLEKGLSYVQYGDFKGFSVNNYLNFSRYSRALTGLSFHIDGRLVELNGILAPDGQVVSRDVFRANGTYGPFVLTKSPIIPNSEEVFVETHDRVSAGLVLRRVKLEPGSDYELDPLTGRLDLKSPVLSFDDDLNPNYIVVIYEFEGNGGRLAYGGELTLHPAEKVTAGLLFGHSSPNRNTTNEVRGGFVNFGFSWFNSKFELAESYENGRYAGRAMSAEFGLNPFDWFTLNGRYARKSGGFSNPTSTQPVNTAGSEDGMVAARLSFTKKLGIDGRLNVRQMGEDRRGVSGEALLRSSLKKLSIGLGYRVSREFSDTSASGADMAVLSFQSSLLKRLRLNFRHEQVVSSIGNLSFEPPHTMLKANFAFTKWLGFAVMAEHRWDSTGRTVGLAGFDMKPWGDGRVYTKYRMDDVGSNARNQAIVGLSQAIPINRKLKVQGSIEYVHELSGGIPPRLGLALGGEYNGRSGKTSLRFSDMYQQAHRVNLIFSSAMRLKNGLGLVLNERLGAEKGIFRAEGVWGLAYRPLQTDKLNVFASLRHWISTDSLSSSNYGNRVVALVDWNYQPLQRLTFYGRIGAKTLLISQGEPLSTYLLSAWVQYEFLRDRLYAALGTRSLMQRATSSSESDMFVETGLIVKDGLMLGVGYNLYGVSESSWTGFDDWRKGFYVALRVSYLRIWHDR